MNFSIYVLIFALTITLRSVIGLELTPRRDRKDPLCFHFSWFGPNFDEEKSKNCSDTSKYKNIPCIRPFEISLTPPNLTDMWYDKSRNISDFTCVLRPGYSCIKYTFSFNDAILNSTYFCGKMIEDKVNAINTGCYTQTVGGHIIEACACRSSAFKMPCNSSVKNMYSILPMILFITSTLYISII